MCCKIVISQRLFKMQHDITRCIFCISNNFTISRQRTQLQKFYKRGYISNLTYLSNALKKILDKISFHRHLKGFDRSLEFSLKWHIIRKRKSYPNLSKRCNPCLHEKFIEQYSGTIVLTYVQPALTILFLLS